MRNLILVASFLFLLGCSQQPLKFQIGEEVLPPHGCVEYRQRGGNC